MSKLTKSRIIKIYKICFILSYSNQPIFNNQSYPGGWGIDRLTLFRDNCKRQNIVNVVNYAPKFEMVLVLYHFE